MSVEPRNDDWPTLQGGALVERGDTGVGAPPPFVPPPPPPPDRRPNGAALFAIGALALAVAGAAAAWLYLYMHRHDQPARTVVVTTAPSTIGTTAALRKVTVPRLVGLPAARATARLRRLGLDVTVIRKRPVGQGAVVVSQVPRAGVHAARHAPVTIVVAGGTRSIRVPDVTQQTLGRAEATLRRLGLKFTTTRVTTSHLPAGVVVQQVPKPGQKVAKSSLITLSVAKAPAGTTATTAPTSTTSPATTTAPTTTAPSTTAQAPTHPASVTVPDVTNQRESAAVDSLANAGILPSLAFVPSSDPLGTVEQQAKPSGTTLPYHAHMQINISEGPSSPPSERVPNVVGQTLDQALASINGAHLRLIFVKLDVTRAQAGKIVQQSPLADGSAPQNAQVLVFLGVFPRA